MALTPAEQVAEVFRARMDAGAFRTMKDSVPVRTGDLKRSLRWDVLTPTDHTIVARLHLLEYGLKIKRGALLATLSAALTKQLAASAVEGFTIYVRSALGDWADANQREYQYVVTAEVNR